MTLRRLLFGEKVNLLLLYYDIIFFILLFSSLHSSITICFALDIVGLTSVSVFQGNPCEKLPDENCPETNAVVPIFCLCFFLSLLYFFASKLFACFPLLFLKLLLRVFQSVPSRCSTHSYQKAITPLLRFWFSILYCQVGNMKMKYF